MTAQTFLLERIASTGKVFRFWVEVMPEDKRDWIPAIDGTAQTRSVNDMLGELIEVNRMRAKRYRCLMKPLRKR